MSEQSQNSGTQNWNVGDYRNFAGFVPVLGEALLELLAAKAGEHILDLGCGEGSLTQKIMAQEAVVTGVDADAAMVEAARKAGVNAAVMNGAQLTFTNAFDAVFSNAALHWMRPPETVIAGVHRALKKDGRFVAEMGGVGNTQVPRSAFHHQLEKRGIDPTAHDPWFFPAQDEYRALLEGQGFEVLHMELFKRPTPAPDIQGWLTTFGGSFLKALPEKKRDVYLKAVAAEVEGILLQDASGHYFLDYVRLRFKAIKR